MIDLAETLRYVGQHCRDGAFLLIAHPGDPRIVWANRALSELTGIPETELAAAPLDLLDATDGKTGSIAACLAAEAPRRFLGRLRHRTAGALDVELDLQPLPVGGDHRPWLGFARPADPVPMFVESVLETVPAGIWVADPVRVGGEIVDFCFVLANPEAERLLQRSGSELLGGRLLELFPGAAETDVFATYRGVAETGEPARFEVTYRHEGLDATYQVNAARTRDGRLLVIFTDVSDQVAQRVTVTAALAEAEAARTRLARLADNAPGVLYQVRVRPGAPMRWLYYSRGWPTLIGATPEQAAALENGLPARLHPDDRAWYQAVTTQAPDSLRPLDRRIRLVGSDGVPRWIRVLSTPEATADGATDWHSYAVDISAEVAAEEALRAAKLEAERLSQRLGLATSIARLGVWTLDPQSYALTWNDEMFGIYGLDRASFDGTLATWDRCVHPDDRAATVEALRAVRATPASVTTAFRIVRPDGSLRHLRGTAALDRSDPTRPLVVGINQDVTDLVEAAARAQSSNLAKSVFLANMSHEIRTPLNGVLGMADALATLPLPSAASDMVKVMQAAGRELVEILNDILDLSRIEAGGLTLESAPFDPAATLQGVIRLNEPAARVKGLSLSLALPAAPMGLRLGDSLRLNQILNNLVANAIKFTAQGSVRVQVSAEGDNDFVTIEVIDTGIGIPREAADRIFDRFRQGDDSMPRRFGGSGLGLAIADGLATAMGGRLSLESTVGSGSTFRLDLPLPHAAAARDATDGDQARPRTDLRLLAAEDNPMNRTVLAALLGSFGLAATFVEDGAEAVALVRESGPWDVVLMDIAMPVMDGVAATRAIRSWEAATGRPRVPIIAVTANALPEQVAAYRAAGLDDVVVKPVSADRLRATLARQFSLPDLESETALA